MDITDLLINIYAIGSAIIFVIHIISALVSIVLRSDWGVVDCLTTSNLTVINTLLWPPILLVFLLLFFGKIVRGSFR